MSVFEDIKTAIEQAISYEESILVGIASAV